MDAKSGHKADCSRALSNIPSTCRQSAFAEIGSSVSTKYVGGVAFYQSQLSMVSCFVTSTSNGGKASVMAKMTNFPKPFSALIGPLMQRWKGGS